MWKFKRLLLVALFLIGATVMPGFVQAESLPEGGSGFESATVLDTNTTYTYEDNRIEADQKLYYKLEDIKAGQNLTITDTLNTDIETQEMLLYLYNEDREALEEENGYTEFSFSRMPNKDQSYYLVVQVGAEYGGNDVAFDLSIETEDYFVGETGRDAGDEITNAIELPTSTITGYLAGEDEKGLDRADYYKVEIVKGRMLDFRITPSAQARVALEIYNSDRERLTGDNSSNEGAIVEKEFVPMESGEYFIAIKALSNTEEIVEYTLQTEEKDASEATGPSSENIEDQMPSEEEMRDIQNQIEQQLNGESAGWVSVVRGIVFNIIKYVAIVLGVIILVIILIIVLLKKGKSGDKEEPVTKEKPESKEQE